MKWPGFWCGNQRSLSGANKRCLGTAAVERLDGATPQIFIHSTVTLPPRACRNLREPFTGVSTPFSH
eukprot:s1213_g17.t1